MSLYRGRYAPSPTGPLHVGNALSSVIAWHRARTALGKLVMRVEDLDTPRNVAGMAERHLADMRWLGLDFDEGPFFQSERIASYQRAIDALIEKKRAYYCTCSRKQIALASAPHGPGDEGPRYPGVCRGRSEKPDGRYSIRFLVEPGVMAFDDALQGHFEQDVDAAVGDFVIARADGIIAYQLAVVVDDIAMGITEVVRGSDLLFSTPRQMQLHQALGAEAPSFAHVPLVVASKDGAKLSKRDGAHTLEGLRANGADGIALRQKLLQARGVTIALEDLL